MEFTDAVEFAKCIGMSGPLGGLGPSQGQGFRSLLNVAREYE